MCIWSTIVYQYIWEMLLTYQYFSFESVHGEAMLKMGWVVKKWIFSFWTAINWSKCILMVSVHIWLSIYTNNAILCIIWKFDLSSRGVLGRIYALSIEVLCQNLKLKMFGLSPLPMQNPFSKTFLDIKVLFVNRFSKILRHILGMLNHNQIVFAWGSQRSDMRKASF